MKAALLEELRAARAAKRAVVLCTNLASGEQVLLAPESEHPLAAAARAALARDESGTVEGHFLHVFNPPLRLVLVGAVHVAQALAKMAALAGFEVVVVDPRRAFATAERFPGVEIVATWPDAALAALAPDARTAVVTLTHDPKLDDPALAAAVASPAFYIGALGSTRTHASRLGRLRERGFDDPQLARIHGPVGLPLGARTATEIAVSILAQIVQALRKP
jgi:xanthine dehydrogenase accessory factor